MRDEESSLGVAGAIVRVREKQTTPGGIFRIIYLKWQRRFREPNTRGRVLTPTTRHTAHYQSSSLPLLIFIRLFHPLPLPTPPPFHPQCPAPPTHPPSHLAHTQPDGRFAHLTPVRAA